MDKFTRVVGAATQLLLLEHSYRTALGTVIGVAIYSLIKFFSPLLNKYAYIIDITQINAIEGAFLGIALLHLPHLLKMFFHPKDIIFDENLKKAFAVIEEARIKGKLSKHTVGDLYIQLATNYLKSTEIKPEARKEQASNGE